MNIMLVCSAGMSTSMLVQKMRKAAEEKGVNATINATSESDLGNHLDKLDVILIGPQVRYLSSKIVEKSAPYNIKVDIINQMYYGMMNGEKVLEQAQELLQK
ncbi:PTS system cellobiose-specific IIB component [Bacillus pakistanensis]|uniref:PTS system cellobiose-specific IIB component n=1 Tax=Rossellomorea pakistanensis TaxID=992288 RepID=A0ABS2NJQ5_9BACI|nr:PTS sugar transporter subunit IIB [Bacillus pakistanensis]MBM7588078.1 PTS system cellobiose-specific IIB component [Bacillus pakistanensis]